MPKLRNFLATPFLLLSWAADWVAFHAWYICWAIAGEQVEAEPDDEEDWFA